jgi:hypothetical protein
MNNHLVAHHFIEFWTTTVRFKRGDDVLFRASIAYRFGGTAVQGESVVQIHRHGIEADRIAIVETKQLSADTVHLDLSPDFQTYKLDEGKNLVVTGSSPKMKGKYEVIISPIEAVNPKEYWSGGAV